MLLQELFGAQISDPDSQQNHQQAYHDPEGSVCGQQGVEWYRQQGEEIVGFRCPNTFRNPFGWKTD